MKDYSGNRPPDRRLEDGRGVWHFVETGVIVDAGPGPLGQDGGEYLTADQFKEQLESLQGHPRMINSLKRRATPVIREYDMIFESIAQERIAYGRAYRCNETYKRA